eukprot:GHUV01022847.1.p1 GENE.GHUV01022847.1~~GHUV01022847.1.p1  ORF type:complete len:119 (+),score=21.13 GHUV01022847.1:600-956(+)
MVTRTAKQCKSLSCAGSHGNAPQQQKQQQSIISLSTDSLLTSKTVAPASSTMQCLTSTVLSSAAWRPQAAKLSAKQWLNSNCELPGSTTTNVLPATSHQLADTVSCACIVGTIRAINL